MRFCSSFCYTSTQIKCCWLSRHKARFRSKCMHSQSLYYQAKPSPCQASLLKREKKLYLPAKGILSYPKRGSASQGQFPEEQGFHRRTRWLGESSSATAFVRGPVEPMQDPCFMSASNVSTALLQGCSAVLSLEMHQKWHLPCLTQLYLYKYQKSPCKR